jgi:hypothetical protein
MGSTKYSDGTYYVEVREDGAIFVRPGDWLSKYSAAIYHNTTTLEPFMRPPLRAGEPLRRISDKNRIVVGDTVIHEPTWTAYWEGRGQPVWNGPVGLDIEAFLRMLHDEGGVQGERLSRMSSLLTGTKWRDISEANALKQLAYLSLESFKGWGMLNGSMMLPEMVSGVPGFIAVFQMTFQAMVVLLDAQESALRFQGLRAIAYATTAFAFGDPIPVLPYGIECNENTKGGTNLFVGTISLDRKRANWMNVAHKATATILADVAARGVDKQVYQKWIQCEGTNRRQLARTLMDEIAKNMSKMLPVDRTMFMSPAPIYPNDMPDNRSALCY